MLDPEELRAIKLLLAADAFRMLTGGHGATVRGGAENFIAEVPREGTVQRVLLINPDRKRPFPQAAASVIDWLQRLTPKDASALASTEFPDVCPRLGDPVRPVLAASCR